MGNSPICLVTYPWATCFMTVSFSSCFPCACSPTQHDCTFLYSIKFSMITSQMGLSTQWYHYARKVFLWPVNGSRRIKFLNYNPTTSSESKNINWCLCYVENMEIITTTDCHIFEQCNLTSWRRHAVVSERG